MYKIITCNHLLSICMGVCLEISKNAGMLKKTAHAYTPLAGSTYQSFAGHLSLYFREQIPDSTEELVSPFHCSLNSTIELTRWKDKLEQKLNAPRGGLRDLEPLFLSKAISLRIRKCISQFLPTNKIQQGVGFYFITQI